MRVPVTEAMERHVAAVAPIPATAGRMTLAQACAALTSGAVTRYVPPADVCGCGRCAR